MMLWDRFYDLVLPELSGIQPNFVDLQLRMAAIEFLEETQVWMVKADPIDVLANTATYALVPPVAILHADVAQVKDVRLNGAPLVFTTMDELRQSATNYETVSDPNPRGFTQYTQDTLTLVPTPSQAYPAGLTMKLALRPGLTALGVEDWIGQKWIQEISTGAKAMLMAMYGRPWSSPEGAAAYRAQFEAAKTRATIEANRSFTRANSTIQMPRFG